MLIVAVFCDFLDVTYAPDDLPLFDLNACLLSLGFVVECFEGGGDYGKRAYRPPEGGGKVDVLRTKRFGRVSLSGAALAFLRASGGFLELLCLLGDRPHKVTRLDAALDLPRDGGAFVRSLHRRYPSAVNLGRKALATSVLLAAGSDGKQTGTWYAGYRSAARVTARVYDKAWETFCKRGVVVDPTLRVEITVRKDFGATLRDAAEPAALFWSAASPAILPAPKVLPMRPDPADLGWKAAARLAHDPAAVLRRRVEESPELAALEEIADHLGVYGRAHLARLILTRLKVDPTPEGALALVR